MLSNVGRVLLCLKRALRIAHAAQQMSSATRGTSGPMTLFVEILNKWDVMSFSYIYISAFRVISLFVTRSLFQTSFVISWLEHRLTSASQTQMDAAKIICGEIKLTFVTCGCIRYLYHFEKGNPQVTSSVIQGLLELIVTDMQSEATTHDLEVDAFLASTVRYIQFQKQKGDSIAEQYASIEVQWDVHPWLQSAVCYSFLEVILGSTWEKNSSETQSTCT